MCALPFLFQGGLSLRDTLSAVTHTVFQTIDVSDFRFGSVYGICLVIYNGPAVSIAQRKVYHAINVNRFIIATP